MDASNISKVIAINVFLHAWLLCHALKTDEPTIHQVHLIFRNELSVQSETYTNDPNRYINQAWGLPAGELTEDGKSQMIKMGQEIRKQKYPHFAKSNNFNPGDVYVRSADNNRNILSAQMLLGGFYNTVTDLKRAVPVHSAPSDQDYLLSDYDCPNYKMLLDEQHSLASEALSEDDFLDQLSNNTGYPVQTFDDIISLHAILHAQKLGNSTMTLKAKNKKDKELMMMKIIIPEWLQERTTVNNKSMTIWERIEYTTGLAHGLAAKTVDMQRFHGGPLLVSVAKRFNDYVLGVKPSPILYLYSVESLTLANILSALESLNDTVPNYGDAIAIELHKIAGDHTVKISKIKPIGTGIRINSISVPGCKTSECPVSQFQEFVNTFTVENIDEECRMPSFHCVFCNKHVVAVITSLSVVIFVLVVVIILIGVILKYRQKREESHKKLEAQYHFHEKGQPWNTLSTLQDTN